MIFRSGKQRLRHYCVDSFANRKQGIIEIFEVRGRKKIAMSEMTHKEEVDLLQMIIKSLERTLKMANIKAEDFEYMNGSPEGVWDRPVKKVEAERLKHSKKSTRK